METKCPTCRDSSINETGHCTVCSLQLVYPGPSWTPGTILRGADFEKKIPAYIEWIVEGLLGKGGMGQVFLVRRTTDSQQEALKVNLAEHMLPRFLREGRIIEDLENLFIIGGYGVCNVGRKDDWPVCAPAIRMEYVQGGKTLAKMLNPTFHPENNGGLPRNVADRYAVEIANALIFLHDNGVIHRDLKPSNVLLRSKGDLYRCVVSDFGIAKDGNSIMDSTLLGGSAGYSAPEQWRGDRERPVGCEADIFSLGCIVYAMLTGVHPYADVLNRWPYVELTDVKPASERNSDLNPELDGLLFEMLQPDPDRRLKTAADFLKRWKELAALRSAPAPPPISPPEPPTLWKELAKLEALQERVKAIGDLERIGSLEEALEQYRAITKDAEPPITEDQRRKALARPADGEVLKDLLKVKDWSLWRARMEQDATRLQYLLQVQGRLEEILLLENQGHFELAHARWIEVGGDGQYADWHPCDLLDRPHIKEQLRTLAGITDFADWGTRLEREVERIKKLQERRRREERIRWLENDGDFEEALYQLSRATEDLILDPDAEEWREWRKRLDDDSTTLRELLKEQRKVYRIKRLEESRLFQQALEELDAASSQDGGPPILQPQLDKMLARPGTAAELQLLASLEDWQQWRRRLQTSLDWLRLADSTQFKDWLSRRNRILLLEREGLFDSALIALKESGFKEGELPRFEGINLAAVLVEPQLAADPGAIQSLRDWPGFSTKLEQEAGLFRRLSEFDSKVALIDRLEGDGRYGQALDELNAAGDAGGNPRFDESERKQVKSEPFLLGLWWQSHCEHATWQGSFETPGRVDEQPRVVAAMEGWQDWRARLEVEVDRLEQLLKVQAALTPIQDLVRRRKFAEASRELKSISRADGGPPFETDALQAMLEKPSPAEQLKSLAAVGDWREWRRSIQRSAGLQIIGRVALMAGCVIVVLVVSPYVSRLSPPPAQTVANVAGPVQPLLPTGHPEVNVEDELARAKLAWRDQNWKVAYDIYQKLPNDARDKGINEMAEAMFERVRFMRDHPNQYPEPEQLRQVTEMIQVCDECGKHAGKTAPDMKNTKPLSEVQRLLEILAKK